MSGSNIVVGLRDLSRLGSYLVDHWSEGGGDIDGGELFDWLTASGVIEEIPGGFDSNKHEAGNHDPEEGDPWYETTRAVKVARRWLELKDQREREALPSPTEPERSDTDA